MTAASMSARIGALALGAALTAAPAAADTIYRYQGPNFDTFVEEAAVPGAYDTTMSTFGWISFAAALPPNMPLTNVMSMATGFSFNQGQVTITDANATSAGYMYFETDAAGGIVNWAMATRWDLDPLDPDGLTYTAFTSSWDFNTNTVSYSDGSYTIYCAAIGGCPPGPLPAGAFDQSSVRGVAGEWSIAAVPAPLPAALLPGALGLLALRRRARASA